MEHQVREREHRTIVVGASAGGLDALSRLLVQFRADLPAPVFVVLHVAPQSGGTFAHILNRSSPLTVALARNGEPIAPGRVYVAPPDHHLLLDKTHVRVVRGPRENRSRPAIDPLFRSAAAHHGPRTIGILLTGLLDDGVAGLSAIARCGGTTIVQEPEEALHPDLPLNALKYVDVDYRLPINRMGVAIERLLCRPVDPDAVVIPNDIRIEAQIPGQVKSDISRENALGVPAPYSCPECGGPLWKVDAKPDRYRCHVGHGYTAQTLVADQADTIEHALWAALRTLEERSNMLARMADRTREDGYPTQAADLDERAAESKRHARVLRSLLLHGSAPELSEMHG